jgi:hypothetical protein
LSIDGFNRRPDNQAQSESRHLLTIIALKATVLPGSDTRAPVD